MRETWYRHGNFGKQVSSGSSGASIRHPLTDKNAQTPQIPSGRAQGLFPWNINSFRCNRACVAPVRVQSDIAARHASHCLMRAEKFGPARVSMRRIGRMSGLVANAFAGFARVPDACSRVRRTLRMASDRRGVRLAAGRPAVSRAPLARTPGRSAQARLRLAVQPLPRGCQSRRPAYNRPR